MQLKRLRKNKIGFSKPVKLLVALLAVCIFLQPSFGTITASAVTQEEIDELNEELNELDAERERIQNQLDSLSNQKEDALYRKALIEDKIAVTEEQIKCTDQEIDRYVALIAEKEVEIVELQKQEAEQLKKYRARVRVMEESGSISYLSILFGASSFSDLLARFDFVSEIMASDKLLYDNLIKAREATQAAKAELEVTKQELEGVKQELENLKADYDAQVSELNSLIAEIIGNINTYSYLEDEADKRADALWEQINAKTEELERQKEEERIRKELEAERQRQLRELQQQQSSGGESYSYSGDGTYIWPTASNSITSPFGYRVHPITGQWKFHSGIDIGGGGGNPVRAAASGTVILVLYDDQGYGNYVVVSHGNTTTLYAHMSYTVVSQGQYVNQGDTLGYVGTTGLSTGYHLHFEMAVNGERIDPLSVYSSSQWVKCWS